VICKRLVLIALAIALIPAAASAQRQGRGPTGLHRFEISPFGGYTWTFARDFYLNNAAGRLDVKDSGMWGIALDINLPYKPGSQVQLLYNRQDSKLQWKAYNSFDTREVDFDTEYWHIGGLYGLPQGNILPFTLLTLGGTRYIVDGGDDVWKFSIIFGLGAKVYANDRFGLKFQGRFPMTIFSGGGAIGCGTGGCYTSIGGSGVAQFDLSAGVMLLL